MSAAPPLLLAVDLLVPLSLLMAEIFHHSGITGCAVACVSVRLVGVNSGRPIERNHAHGRIKTGRDFSGSSGRRRWTRLDNLCRRRPRELGLTP